MNGFNTVGNDKGGGGLALIYKENLSSHEWSPSVPESQQYIQNERQWLLLSHGNQRFAFLHCYIACQNEDKSFIRWNEDLFQLIKDETIKLRRDGFMVLAMGDFNTHVGQIPGLLTNDEKTNRNKPMFMNFIAEANLVIINTLPVSKGTFT